jgi:hypothetical protein
MANKTELAAVIRTIDATAAGVNSAKKNLGSLADLANGIGDSITGSLGGIVAGFFAVDQAIGFVMNGIRNASEMKDLHAQIVAVDGDLKTATRTLAFFEDAQIRTRRSGDDMAKVYGELLPLAMQRGFNRQDFRETIVQLDQFATRIHKLPDEVNDAFAQIMTGKAGDKNIIIRALGIDADSVQQGKIGANEVMAKIREIARQGEDMGDDFDSAWTRIKNGLTDAFSEGWNSAEKSTEDGVARIKKRVEDPEFLQAIRNIGGALRGAAVDAGNLITLDRETIARKAIESYFVVGGPVAMHYGSKVSKRVVTGVSDWWSDLDILGSTLRSITGSQGAGVLAHSMRQGRTPPRPPAPEPPEQAPPSKLDFRNTEEMRKRAEAEAKLAELREKRAAALEWEIKILQTSAPLQRAEVEYARDLALALEEPTERLRELSEIRAGLLRQAKLDTAFTALVTQGSELWGANPLKDMQAYTPGVRGLSAEYRRARAVEDAVAALSQSMDDLFAGMDDDYQRRLGLIDQWKESFGSLRTTLSDAALDFATTGGENLGRIAAQRFGEFSTKGFDQLFGRMFSDTVSEVEGGGWRINGLFAPRTIYDTQTEAVSVAKRRSELANTGLDYAAIGVSSYGAARAGEGSRTGSVVSAAASMYGMTGNAYAAIAAAMVAALGGYFGEQQRHDEYKYGMPMIDMYGQASVQGIKNIEPLERQAMTIQLQERYNSARNASVRLMEALKIQPEANTFGALNLTFQRAPSGNFMKHWSELFTSGAIDTAVFKQVNSQVRSGFEKIGLKGARFDQMTRDWGNLDPQKMLQMLQGVALGLTDIQKASEFLGAKNGYGKNTSWFQGITSVQKEMAMTFADQIREAQGSIIEKAGYLDDLVGDEQITALQELGSAMLDLRQRERDEIRATLQLLEQVKEKGIAARDRYAVMGMVKDDKERSPDYQRIASFYKGKADETLERIGRAKTREEAERLYDQYMSYLDLVVQQGFSINNQTGIDWSKWASDQTWKGESAIAAILEKFGIDTQSANAEFMAKWQPIIDKFTSAGEAAAKLPDDISGPLNRYNDALGNKTLPILTLFTGELGNANSALHDFDAWLADILKRYGVPQPPNNPNGGNTDGGHSRWFSSPQSSGEQPRGGDADVYTVLRELVSVVRLLIPELRDLGGAAGDAAVRLDSVLLGMSSASSGDRGDVFESELSTRRSSAA